MLNRACREIAVAHALQDMKAGLLEQMSKEQHRSLMGGRGGVGRGWGEIAKLNYLTTEKIWEECHDELLRSVPSKHGGV